MKAALARFASPRAELADVDVTELRARLAARSKELAREPISERERLIELGLLVPADKAPPRPKP